jgi:hypothetical protein
MNLAEIIDLDRYPIADPQFMATCRQTIDRDGALPMPGFMREAAIVAVREEGLANRDKAYFCKQWHNVYVTPPDPGYPESHPLNRLVPSTKGCITDDQIAADSALRVLYDSDTFRSFVAYVLGEEALHPYADPLSSINLHYAGMGQELGWHFDNSSFAITLMIQPAASGGAFEYVRDVRDADSGDMGFEAVSRILDGEAETRRMAMDAGALLMFRGRNAIHRVTPNVSETTRMLVVLAYNSKPGISLSEKSRMTFYGRLI